MAFTFKKQEKSKNIFVCVATILQWNLKFLKPVHSSKSD